MSRKFSRPACGGNPTASSSVVPPSAATYAVTTVSFTSDPQDFIGQGAFRAYTLQNADIRANVARSGGLISVPVRPLTDPPSPEWSLLLIASSGQITPGSYDTTRSNTSSTYGLDFIGNNRVCNTAAGHVVIHSVELGPDLFSVRHLRVSFENHCNGSSAVLRGEVAVLSDPVR